ncbi:MAG: hypothetical protein KDJ22_11770 [Candidatus Competibacteraceae bacterium]|nr:hypothetical protein [Candidatus Competibacteraceae bacterium]
MAAMFKSILLAILKQVTLRLIGATNWEEILRAVVETAFDKAIPKENKFDVAFGRIKAALPGMSDSDINLGIEAAVKLVKNNAN